MLFGYEKLKSLIISIYFVSLRYLHLGVVDMISNKSPSLVSLSLHIQLLKTFSNVEKKGPSLISNFFFRVCSKSANSEDY